MTGRRRESCDKVHDKDLSINKADQRVFKSRELMNEHGTGGGEKFTKT